MFFTKQRIKEGTERKRMNYVKKKNVYEIYENYEGNEGTTYVFCLTKVENTNDSVLQSLTDPGVFISSAASYF